jgi:hypothetical protein
VEKSNTEFGRIIYLFPITCPKLDILTISFDRKYLISIFFMCIKISEKVNDTYTDEIGEAERS